MIGCNKFRMLREACSFYRGICPNPTPSEYVIMAQTLCEKFPQIKDKLAKNEEYWKTTKDYISQRYRNKRRKSDPIDDDDDDDKRKQRKIVTVSHAVPVVADEQESDSDVVAYERNMKVLLSEYKNHPTNESHIQKLLKVTHKLRRDKIHISALATVDIQKESSYAYMGNISPCMWVTA